jgi:[protein-PII] uridylyltransferase
VLTGWQAAILHELYHRTLARLTGGREDKPNHTQIVERLREVVTDDVPLQAVKAHVAMVPERYLANTSVQRMAEHLRLIARLDGVPVATELFQHPDLGTSAFVVVTRDVPGLFSLIAGTLAAYGVNITSAQIATRADGVVIDTFQVNDPAEEIVTARAAWNRVVDALRAVLAGEQSVETLLARRQRAAAARANGFGRPRVIVDNRLSDDDTVIEIKCADRLGLLYLITRTLSSEGLDIASARIATEIDQAYDTFYVHDRAGRKLVEPEATDRIRHTLESALMQSV